MKQKILIALILALVLAVIAAALIFFSSGTKEYKFSDLLSLETQTEDFQTGGSIRKNALKKYRIVYSAGFTEEEIALVHKLGDVIAQNTGISTKICNTKEGKTENTYTVTSHEILLGLTYRPESIYLHNNIWDGSASCTMIGKKLVLAIGDEANTIEILTRFINLIEENCKSDTEFFFDDNDAFLDIGTAPVQSLYLNDLPITEYTIINPAKKDASYYEESAFLAEVFRQRLGALCGHFLPVQNIEDDTPKTAGALYIGIKPTLDSLLNDMVNPTADTASWNIYAEGNSIFVTGTASNCTAKAIDALITKLTPSEENIKFSAHIDTKELVSVGTDISILRIDMMDQWPAIDVLRKDVYKDFPDLFVLENASDSIGNTFTNEFNGYYKCKSIEVFTNVYFCSSRFYVLDEGQITLPEDGDRDEILHGTYLILEDQMTNDEIVIFTSNVNEQNIEEFERTIDYLCFPNKRMIYLGNEVPNRVKELFKESTTVETEKTLSTMIRGDWDIVEYEDRAEEIITKQQGNAIIWYGKCEAHMLRLEYTNN